MTLHLFTRREAKRMLKKAGFRLLEVRPVSLRPDGRLPLPGFFGWLRSYGYLLAAERPSFVVRSALATDYRLRTKDYGLRTS